MIVKMGEPRKLLDLESLRWIKELLGLSPRNFPSISLDILVHEYTGEGKRFSSVCKAFFPRRFYEEYREQHHKVFYVLSQF